MHITMTYSVCYYILFFRGYRSSATVVKSNWSCWDMNTHGAPLCTFMTEYRHLGRTTNILQTDRIALSLPFSQVWKFSIQQESKPQGWRTSDLYSMLLTGIWPRRSLTMQMFIYKLIYSYMTVYESIYKH